MGMAEYLALDTGSRQPRWNPHQRVQPRSQRKHVFLPKETRASYCSQIQIPPSKRNSTTSHLYITSSVSLLSYSSSHVSPKSNSVRQAGAGVIISIFQPGQAGKISPSLEDSDGAVECGEA